MRSLLLYVIYMVVFILGQAADVEEVTLTRGDKAQLQCPAVTESEEYNSIMWNKDTVFFLTAGKTQPVKYASGAPERRITLSSSHHLSLAHLEMSDSGNYSCQIYVLKNGTWELRETLYSLIVQDVPSAPGRPEFKDIQSRQVTVKWTASDANNSPISSYILIVRDCQANITMMEVATQSSSLEMTVYGLSPYTCYVVTVLAVNEIGHSNPSQLSNPFYTKEEDMEDGNSTAVVMDCRFISADAESQYVMSVKFESRDAELNHNTFHYQHLCTVRQEPYLNENVHEGSPDEADEFMEKLTANMVRKWLFIILALVLVAGGSFPQSKSRHVAFFSLLPVPCYSYGKDSDVTLGIIWFFVGLILIMLIICYKFRMWRMCYNAAHKYMAVPGSELTAMVDIPTEESCLKPEENYVHVVEKVYPDIDVGDFIRHVELLKKDGDLGFSREFFEITEASKNDCFPCENFSKEKNIQKNRYVNIAAYDHSRVILKTNDTLVDQFDYINANYIHGYKKPNAYIATQGPLPNTVSDFWQMVWEQNTNVIVMITNLMEKGRVKCHQYWPTTGEETYGNLTVKLVSTDSRAYYTVKVFSLFDAKFHCDSTKSEAERTVYHYHYTEWPDHGVPDFALPVIAFVQKSVAQSGPDNGPIIVHCSAGVGRTGTYILIDSMIEQIKDRKSVNIPGFIRDIRKQRNFLVQTEIQYKFIHEVLVEYLAGGGPTEVREDHLSDYLHQLEQPFKSLMPDYSTRCSLLEKQFQQITEYFPTKFEILEAQELVNQSKNRKGSLLPVCLSRVVLPARPGVAGSDYVNASFLQGHRRSEEFIVTQTPMEDTVEDFWRMVWDKKSPAVVVLCSHRDKKDKDWIPNGTHKVMDTEFMSITTKNESVSIHTHSFTTLDIALDYKEAQLRNGDGIWLTKVITVKDWPFCYEKLHQLFDPIVATQSYLASLECGPVVVMDRLGGVEAGMFCALWTLRDQLLSEKCADFYQVCKLYHYKRPGIIGSKENYLYLHQVMAALYEHLSSGSPTRQSSHQKHQQTDHRRHKHGSFCISPPKSSIKNGKSEMIH